MTMTSRIRRLLAAATLIALAGVGLAADRFGVTAFGSFKRMAHTGDASAKVKLVELAAPAGSWGVGALAGLTGEVLVHDGRVLVSRGDEADGRTSAIRPDDSATLLALGRVSDWIDVPVLKDMSQPQFEAFVIAQARALGLDVDAPWPFRVQGRYPQLTWHVVNGTRAPAGHGGGHGSHANKHADMRVFEQAGARGELIGIHTGTRLEGVASHPGERFHVHYADVGLTVSGHVDAYAVAQGAVLKLPAK